MRSLPLLPTGLLAYLLAAHPAPAASQPFPWLAGVEPRLGVAAPEEADAGLSLSGEVDLGYLWSPGLRVIAGLNHFRADVDRPGVEEGDLTATGGLLALRADLLPRARLSPFALGGLSWHQVSADVPGDSQLEGLLDGAAAGVTAGAGLRWSLDEAGRFGATVTVRQTWANNVDHTTAEAGIRYLLQGRRAYVRPEVQVRQEVEQREREQERVQTAEEARRLSEEERRREETERQRAEEAERRTAEERARAEAERRAAEAEAERRRQAERAQRAEEEAAAARAQARAARGEADAAREQAARAEARMVEALESLRRVLTTVAGIRETERGIVVTLGQGLYASGASELTPTARQEVGRIAAVIAEYPGRTVRVEGHTDDVGSETTNLALSEQRARSVQARLIAEGVDPARIMVTGYGESRPVASNDTAAGRAENRRVEIVIAREPGGSGAN